MIDFVVDYILLIGIYVIFEWNGFVYLVCFVDEYL